MRVATSPPKGGSGFATLWLPRHRHLPRHGRRSGFDRPRLPALRRRTSIVETPTRSPKGTVSRVRGIRRTAAALLAVSLPLVAGCAANTGAQTQVQYQPGIGSDYRQGNVY